MLAARRAIEAQRIRIDKLIKKRDPPIHCLPGELLVRVFGFAMVLPDDTGPNELAMIAHLRRKLASVSLISRRDHRMLVSQLKRSQGVLLDVTIAASTSINFFYHNFRDIIHELTQLEYPSLVGIYIEMVSSWELPATPQNLLRRTPALKYLTLGKFVPINGFSIARPLKALNLMFGVCDIPPSFASQIPIASLIALSLCGDAHDWVLEPNSIHFPLLEKLVLTIPHPGPFLEVITALKLQHLELAFDFKGRECQWEAFDRFRSKFGGVHHLNLQLMTDDSGASISADALNGVTFCRVFVPERLLFLITPIPLPGNSVGPKTSIDNWTSLERLKISVHFRTLEEFDPLAQWLAMRQEFGLRRLQVNFNFKFMGHLGSSWDPTDFSILCICLPVVLLSLRQDSNIEIHMNTTWLPSWKVLRGEHGLCNTFNGIAAAS
ncbi:hypothetical protein BKA82DRAFT_4341834 [Pisolithus tinctorius]|nr:hypothetical protein BKA82DRAFT_4341834 [Pisolithus tinctorius]